MADERDEEGLAAEGDDSETTADGDDDRERGWVDKVVDVLLEIADLV